MKNIIAWMGGSSPKPILECSHDEVRLVAEIFAEQVETYSEFWKVPPDDDTISIFWNRARHDAHATFRENSK